MKSITIEDSGLVPADYAKGFGGKFGVQKDRVDKSAVGWDYQEKVGKHESQTGICCNTPRCGQFL